MDEIAISAQRLLKFKFPVQQHNQTFERLLTRQLHSPKLPKKFWDDLSSRTLEDLYHQLWTVSLPASDPIVDAALTVLILLEDLAQYQLEELVSQDIKLLGLHSGEAIHSYYFEGQLNRATLKGLLTQFHCRTDFLDASSDDSLLFSYLLCRRLNQPLPWQALFSQLNVDQLKRYPIVHRVFLIHQYLAEQGYYQRLECSPEKIIETQTILTSLMRTHFVTFAVQTQVTRPVQTAVIVEGATEEILLPQFALALGINFYQEGILVMPAGGKNQVIALYQKLAEVVNIPIVSILDQDAAPILEGLKKHLRSGDQAFLLAEGEFEDLYDLDLVLKTINEHYHPHPRITRHAFSEDQGGRVASLKNIWRHHQLGDFDKTDFAMKLTASFSSSITVPQPIRQLIEAIIAIRHEAP